MNCLWIILLLSCFGDWGGNMGGCCGNNSGCGNGRGRDNNSCGSDNCGCDRDEHRNGCSRAVEKAVNECGSERAVVRALKDRDRDCGCGSERAERAEAREERAERRAERAERMADNNGCDIPVMTPPHWQDFPEVSRSSSRDDCGCDS